MAIPLLTAGTINNTLQQAWRLGHFGRIFAAQGQDVLAKVLFRQSLLMFHKADHTYGMALSMLGIARLAHQHGQDRRMVRLLAATTSLLASIDRELEPHDTRTHATMLAVASTRLGEPLFKAAYAEGQTMSVTQVVSYALQHEVGMCKNETTPD
jgi:hypothetical protein